MSNEKVYMPDISIGVMDSKTKIDVSRETLKELRKHKALGEFSSYDEMLKYWMKHCPITSPVFREGGE